ncbi:MAG: hypothetical protein HOE83_08285 [Alphaproteobacteria bacterium]|jgi:hypothetical protein|nr:hypothetical protein [Alphaproteobacteria bacterium]
MPRIKPFGSTQSVEAEVINQYREQVIGLSAHIGYLNKQLAQVRQYNSQLIRRAKKALDARRTAA